MKPSVTGLAVVCLGLCGCGLQLQVVKVQQPEQLIEGIPYSLPRKTFTLTVEYELKECLGDRDGGTVNIERRVKLEAALGPDPRERYYIPYESLRNWFKATDLQIESSDGQTLKSVSATISDKTANVLSSLVGTAITAARVAQLPALPRERAAPSPPPPPGARVPPLADPCTDAARAALQRLHELRLEAKAVSDGSGTSARLPGEINVETDRVQDFLKRKYSLAWIPARGEPATQRISPRAAIDAWIRTPDQSRLAAQVASLDTVMDFVTDEDIRKPAEAPAPTSDGLVVRLPVNGTVRVCKGTCPAPQAHEAGTILEVQPHVVPQLGAYVSMPLRNRVFQDNTITLSIGETGVITKMGYKTNAVAEAAAASLNANVDAISKAVTDRATAAATASSPTGVKDRNNAIKECLQAQQALRDAGGTPVGSCQ